MAEVIREILDDLRKIGVRDGDLLIVHSSFKALGLSRISPADVVRTLAEAVGPDGTLMMPTFTYCYSGIDSMRPYNPDTTRSFNMGAIAEALRCYPGALRSGSPTYSVAAIGKQAEAVTANKENACGLGRGSSYEDAYRLGARILLMGVGNNRNSMIHYAEYASQLPINDIPYREFWGRSALLKRNGEAVEVQCTDFPGCSVSFGVVDEYLVENGILARGVVGSATCFFMNARDMVDAIVGQLGRQPDWLFCDSIVCEPCHLRRRRLRERGLLTP